MLLFLHTKIQGPFFALYVGGMWNRATHEYKRETPKDTYKSQWDAEDFVDQWISRELRDKATLDSIELPSANALNAKRASFQLKEIQQDVANAYDKSISKYDKTTNPAGFSLSGELWGGDKSSEGADKYGYAKIYRPLDTMTNQLGEDAEKLGFGDPIDANNKQYFKDIFKDADEEKAKGNLGYFKEILDNGISKLNVVSAAVGTAINDVARASNRDRNIRLKGLVDNALEALKNADVQRQKHLKATMEKYKAWLTKELMVFFEGASPFIPKGGDKPVYNSEQDASNAKEWVEQEGAAYPENKISPVFGASIGYIKSFSGQVFVGIEVAAFKPMYAVHYKLQVEQDKQKEVAQTNYGQVDVDLKVNINPSFIIGKELNPYTSVYAKVGGMFTLMNLKYNVRNEHPPFMKEDRSAFTTEKQFEFPKKDGDPFWLMGISGGLGAMFVNGNVIWSLEYNCSFAQQAEIRKYGTTDDDPHIRGYAYSHLDHRLMIRCMIMKRL
ncbi:MAG: hypothetical protein H6850_02265 [Alphaproteobacteria bacterium]|nr:MAG: hypothetical protein H6850_02265 [Alphaproteobacteria bacterium]